MGFGCVCKYSKLLANENSPVRCNNRDKVREGDFRRWRGCFNAYSRLLWFCSDVIMYLDILYNFLSPWESLRLKCWCEVPRITFWVKYADPDLSVFCYAHDFNVDQGIKVILSVIDLWQSSYQAISFSVRFSKGIPEGPSHSSLALCPTPNCRETGQGQGVEKISIIQGVHVLRLQFYTSSIRLQSSALR